MNKAIILAGGKGTRLAPLTDKTPKPLMPFLGRTLCERIISLLVSSGVTDIMISTGYRSDAIMNKIGSEYGGAKIKYLEETVPLGTAGGLKYAKNLLGLSDDESFLVISGDCVCDFDLADICRHHESSDADVTVVTTECEDPLEYGVVLSDGGGLICGFNEKPPWSQVNCSRVNTGIYAVKTSVIDMIPPGQYDFSKDLFPKMLSEGKKLSEYTAQGYWCDIGNVESYYKCCIDALNGKLSGENPQNDAYFEELRCRGIKITTPCHIPNDCVIENGAVIGPNAIIGANCRIGFNSEIAGTVMHDGVNVGDDCRIEGAIICENAKISPKCNICGGSVVGSGVQLSEKSYLASNTCVTSETMTPKTGEKQFFIPSDELYGNDFGIKLGTVNVLDVSLCEKIGASVARAMGKHSKIGIMYDTASHSRIFAQAVLLGIEREGVFSFNAGEGFEKLARYLSVFFSADCFLYIYTEHNEVYCAIYNKNALSPSRDFERRLERAYRDFDRTSYDGKPRYSLEIINSEMHYYRELYENARAYAADEPFRDIKAAFVYTSHDQTAQSRDFELLKNVFVELGGIYADKKDAQEQSALVVSYSPKNGISISQSNYTLDKYHLAAALIEKEKSIGRSSFVLPFLSPEKYSSLADGADILHFPMNSGKRFNIPPELLKACYWINDDIVLCARALSLIASERKNISAFFLTAPRFAYRESSVTIPDGTAKTLVIKRLSRTTGTSALQDGYEGIKINYPEGTVTVVPGKARTFRIYSEAMNSETADELYERVRKDITDVSTTQ